MMNMKTLRKLFMLAAITAFTTSPVFAEEQSKSEQTFMKKVQDAMHLDAVKEWFSNVGKGVKTQFSKLKKLFPAESEYKGQKMYSCGVEDCSLCFESRKNGIKHLVRCHLLRKTTVKERFEAYPNEDAALMLALSSDLNNDDSQGAQALRSMAISYIEVMGQDRAIAFINSK